MASEISQEQFLRAVSSQNASAYNRLRLRQLTTLLLLALSTAWYPLMLCIVMSTL